MYSWFFNACTNSANFTDIDRIVKFKSSEIKIKQKVRILYSYMAFRPFVKKKAEKWYLQNVSLKNQLASSTVLVTQ